MDSYKTILLLDLVITEKKEIQKTGNSKISAQLTFTHLLANSSVNNRNTRKRCETYSVFIDNFEHVSHLFLVFLLLTLNK